MRLVFVADGRSPTALNWISGMIERGHEVHLVSTFACQPDLPLASLHFLPVAFSGLKASHSGVGANGIRPGSLKGGTALVQVRTLFRQWLGPLTLPRAARLLKGIIDQIQPDLVHAMRIPYEGMVAALAVGKNGLPLLVSVWGNDFTLHAPSTPWMGRATRQALQTASALHSDCRRDVRLARAWGFQPDKPAIVLPGAGGIRTDIFHPAMADRSTSGLQRIINPRGVRAYIRNDAFFKAIPRVLDQFPQTVFVCPNMAGDRLAQRWVSELGIGKSVELLPAQSRAQMAALFQDSQIVVSPSIHDGTPNSLLEAMACGCFPVAGDLESIREWITPGVNGLLVDPCDPEALAEGMVMGMENDALRKKAQRINDEMIKVSADFHMVMEEAIRFYLKIMNGS